MYYDTVDFTHFKKVAGKSKYCLNIVGAFDIETSRYTTNDEDFAFMYMWQFAINDVAVYGRTWTEFVEFLENLKEQLKLTIDHRLVVYVHSLSYEFTFMQHVDGIHFTVKNDYDFIARDKHDIIKCIVNDVFEFRDSSTYIEMSLEGVGEIAGLKKLSLDYDVIRTGKTVLDAATIEYGERDVLILTKFFMHESKKYGSVGTIPLTNTRRIKRIIQDNLRDMDFYGSMKSQNLYNTDYDLETLEALIAAYCPPFCFSQSIFNDIVIYDVTHVDITSFYPALMLFEKYPHGKFVKAENIPDSIDDVFKLYSNKPFMIRLNIMNLKSVYPRFAYLTRNEKFLMYKTEYIDNRILNSEQLVCTVTDIDLKNLLKYYTYSDIDILDIWTAKRYTWLPGYITKTVCDLYVEKAKAKNHIKQIEKIRDTTLKEQKEYERIKSQVDRISGIFVQKPLKYTYTIDNQNNIVRSQEEVYIKSDNDFFVNYAWGVWLLAYARDTMTKIFAAANLEHRNGKYINNDTIVYSDTDCFNYDANNQIVNNIISEYNANVNGKLQRFCERNTEFARYYDLKGIGEFDSKHYKKLKILQLKRYAYVTDNDTFVTIVSGLARDNTYFNQYATIDEKLDAFNNDMQISDEHSNVKKREYKYKHIECDVIDCQNNIDHVVVESYVLINKNDFNCNKVRSISKDIIDTLKNKKSIKQRNKLK